MENSLPSGWSEVAPLDISEKIRGVSYDKNEISLSPVNGLLPVLRANNIDDGILVYKDLVYVPLNRISEKQMLREGDIVIAMSSGSKNLVGKTAQYFANIKSSFGAFCGVLRPSPLLNKKYFGYYFQSKDYRNKISELSAGTNINNLKSEHFDDLQIPIAPLPEQQRIVAKLDALFEKIESNRQRLEKIPKILKRFRQSVLAAAVSGKLTEDWREKNKKIEIYPTENRVEDYDWRNLDFPFSWKWDYIKNMGKHVLGKMLDAAKNKGEPTLYLRNVSVRWFEFDLETLTEIRATKEEKEKFDLRDGDLFICEGGEPGRAAVWNKGENSYIFQKAIHRIRFNQYVNPYWVLYNLKFDADGGNLEALFTGTGIKHLTLKSLSRYPVAIPPLEEQREIVRRVEQLFDFADRIESRYDKAKAMLDKFPQSILAKAFRGELVSQNPNDEPASVLLERIREEKEELATNKKIKKAKEYTIEQRPLKIAAEKKVKYKKVK